MPVLTEKKVDQKLVARFKKEFGPRGVCIKLSTVGAYGTAGWPDRLFLADGLAAFVELKRPGKEPTPLQHQRIGELRAAGHQADWFDDADEAWEWVEAVLKGDRP